MRKCKSVSACVCVCVCQHQGGGGPRNALGHRAEPEVLLLPREAPKCCAWQHQGGGPETRSGTVQSLKCCPCQQKRGARLPTAAPGSIKGGGPPKRARAPCCPCQQKRAARLPSAAPGSIKGGGPRNALGHRPEPEVLPRRGGGAPKRARAPSRASSAAPASRNEARGSQVLRLAASRGGAPKRARAPSRASSAAPASRNGERTCVRLLCVCLVRLPLGHRERRAP